MASAPVHPHKELHIATAFGEKTTEEKMGDNAAYFNGYNNTHE